MENRDGSFIQHKIELFVLWHGKRLACSYYCMLINIKKINKKDRKQKVKSLSLPVINDE